MSAGSFRTSGFGGSAWSEIAKEAKKQGITVGDADVNDRIQVLAKRNNMSSNDFEAMLNSNGVLVSALAFFVVYGVLIGVLPSLGNLAANKAHVGQFGYARAATETPQPITNILPTPLVVDGQTIAPGQIVSSGRSRLWTSALT